MRDHPQRNDRQETDRARDAEHEQRWARMSGHERIRSILDLQNPPEPERRVADKPRGPTNIQRLLDMQGPRSVDKPIPNGWDAPDIRDGRRPDLEQIRLADDRRAHILDGDATGGGHRHGTGLPGKTEFPDGWDDDMIADRVLDTARNPTTVEYSEATRKRPEQWKCDARHDGVDITSIVRGDGQVWTAWPSDGPGVHRNPWSKS